MMLSITEQMYLTAIACLEENAYGVKIREKVIELTGRSMVFGTLYNNLDQLVRKGFVETRRDHGNADSKKVFYSITGLGLEALKESKDLQQLLWAAFPKKLY